MSMIGFWATPESMAAWATALGTAVLKGLGAGGQARQAAHSFLYQLEITAGELAQQNTPLDGFYYPDDTQAGETVEASLSGHLHRVVDTVFDYVDKTDFAFEHFPRIGLGCKLYSLAVPNPGQIRLVSIQLNPQTRKVCESINRGTGINVHTFCGVFMDDYPTHG